MIPVLSFRPFNGCSWSDIYSSLCHSGPFLVQCPCSHSHWLLLYTLLPSSQTGLFSVPTQMAMLSHMAFVHRRPSHGAPPLSSLIRTDLSLTQQNGALNPVFIVRKSDLPPLPPCPALLSDHLPGNATMYEYALSPLWDRKRTLKAERTWLIGFQTLSTGLDQRWPSSTC